MLQQRRKAAGVPVSQPASLDSLVNQTRDAATALVGVGGDFHLPVAQPQSYATPRPLPSNQRYPLPMQMPDGGASSLADAINTGSPVPKQPNYDPAVWGPGGRQYPTAMPAASPAGGLQSPVVAPRYGQSAQQAAMSLQNARQQASDFTNRGVDRIFATNGGPVTTNSSFTGPPNPASSVAQSMPYGSGSILIRTADGRTILAGRSPDSRAESSIATAMSQNGGTVPQGVFDSIQQASAANSAARNAQNPMMTQRRANIKAQDAAARDRQIVSNAMRFGVRNPLAIETAQRMGIRLPGMPRVSGDEIASNNSTMNGPAAAASVANAGNSREWKFLGVDPATAHPSDIMTAVATAAANGQLNEQQWRAVTSAMRQRALADNRLFDGGWLDPGAGRDHRKNAWDAIANSKSPSDYINSKKPAAN